ILSVVVSLWPRSQSCAVEEFALPANLFAENVLEYHLLFTKLRMNRVLFYFWMLGAGLALSTAALAQTDQQIYTDSLVSGWQNWSWATVTLANTSPIHTGTRSASVDADAWEAIYLHHNAFDTSGYTDLVFWIYGGSTGGQLLQVQALLNGTAQTAVT